MKRTHHTATLEDQLQEMSQSLHDRFVSPSVLPWYSWHLILPESCQLTKSHCPQTAVCYQLRSPWRHQQQAVGTGACEQTVRWKLLLGPCLQCDRAILETFAIVGMWTWLAWPSHPVLILIEKMARIDLRLFVAFGMPLSTFRLTVGGESADKLRVCNILWPYS